ncbi:hypothetical protein PGT21_028089 [Puccinia graminis f. sp. tritici]|uniref:Uncharacterized protein n=1 Tax=Puccinia graminis f. sp. tritici TaxID=56615 RepID=A0A5B0PL55_PUCGR|nr:hypothetical protein PGT21_028089 [Puccinia graminis f. sp. tritici]
MSACRSVKSDLSNFELQTRLDSASFGGANDRTKQKGNNQGSSLLGNGPIAPVYGAAGDEDLTSNTKPE